MPLIVSRNRVIVCFILLATLAVQLTWAGPVRAQPLGGPFLNLAPTALGPNGLMSITARGFTEGETVLVVLTTANNETAVHLTTATTSDPVYGPNGSMDPAHGYVPGGYASFLLWQRTLLSVDPHGNPSLGAGAPLTSILEVGWPVAYVYGPNDGGEPVWANLGNQVVVVNCGSTLSLRALDVATATWSNEVPFTPRC